MEKLFQVSNEEHGAPVEVANIEQIITDDSLAQEIAADTLAIEKDLYLLAITEEQIVAVESRVETMESILSDGNVTAATAKMAVVAATTTAVAVGRPLETMAVSVEAADTDPAMTFKVSLEDDRSMIKKMIDGARKLFIKINKNVRKVVAKVIASIGGLKKKGAALESKLEDVNDNANAEFKKEIASSLKDKFAGVAYLKIKAEGGGVTFADLATRGLNLAANLNLKEFVGSTLKNIKEADIEDVKTNISKKAEIILKDVFKDDKALNKAIDSNDVRGFVYRLDGSNLSLVTIALLKKDNGDKYIEVKTKSGSLDTRTKEAMKTTVPKVSKLQSIAGKVKELTDDIKSLVDTSFTFVDDCEKGFESLSKNLGDSDEQSKAMLEYKSVKALYGKSPSLAFGAVMGAYGMAKNSMFLVSESIKAHEKSE